METSRPPQLGRYRVLGLLGSGKTGLVYHGRDDDLDRNVAIKILHEGRGSSERSMRLMDEARAAGRLSSANIVAVYDVGIDAGVPYIVSEFIEGETLRQELNRGPMLLTRALSLATQVADGLAVAHGVGITHGDVKPENVMVTPTGEVKIVDFGLATMVEQLTLTSESASIDDTLPGLIVGTIPYASPERALGGRADTRSDQFSFGVMLFEMCAGSRPFARDSAIETLDAIVHDEAPEIRTLNPRIPPGLPRVLNRCLAKAPTDRYASTRDLALDLRELRDRPADRATPLAEVTRRGDWPRLSAWAAAGATAGALAVTAWLWGVWEPGRLLLSEQAYTPFVTEPGFEGKPAWSPDGGTLAYVAEDDNHVLQVFTKGKDATAASKITRERFNCNNPFWSPKGDYIYFLRPARDKIALYQIPAAGGNEVQVEDNAVSAAISPDGSMLAFFKEESEQGGDLKLWMRSPIDHAAKPFAQAPLVLPGVSSASMAFSPDSSRLLIWFQRWFVERDVLPYSAFSLMSLKTRSVRSVLTRVPQSLSPQAFSWLPDNRHIVTMTSDAPQPSEHLWMADVDGSQVFQVTPNNESDAFPSVSSQGRIAYDREETNFDVMFVPLDGSPLRQVLKSSRDEFDPSASPTRDEFAYITDKTGPLEIDRRSGDDDVRIVSRNDFADVTRALGSLAFSPDGDRMAYQRLSDSGYRLWVSTREGSGPSRLSPPNERYQDAATWSPKGDEVAYITASDGKWFLVQAQPGDGRETTLADDPAPYTRPQWSPNGSFIAYQRSPSGQLALIDVSGPAPTTRPSHDYREWLAFGWNPVDGRLYGLTRGDDRIHFSLARLDVRTNGELADAEILKENLGFIPFANQPIRGFSWKGGGFLTSLANVRSDIWILDGATRLPSFFDLFRLFRLDRPR